MSLCDVLAYSWNCTDEISEYTEIKETSFNSKLSLIAINQLPHDLTNDIEFIKVTVSLFSTETKIRSSYHSYRTPLAVLCLLLLPGASLSHDLRELSISCRWHVFIIALSIALPTVPLSHDQPSTLEHLVIGRPSFRKQLCTPPPVSISQSPLLYHHKKVCVCRLLTCTFASFSWDFFAVFEKSVYLNLCGGETTDYAAREAKAF